VTPSTTTTLCDRLVQKGMISRRAGADRRSVSLFVTSRGQAELSKIATRRIALLREIFLRLPSDVQAPFAAALSAFIEAAGEVGIDEWSIRGLVPSNSDDWIRLSEL
jgi:DNA-binding MarR family transcriptional regulator